MHGCDSGIPGARDSWSGKLVEDLRFLILESRKSIAVKVNAELTLLYWRIGKRILEVILKNERGDYGGEIVVSIAGQLEVDFGMSFGEKNLRHMIKIADVIPDYEIVYAMRRQLSWTHIRRLIYIENYTKRCFYMEIAMLEGWTTRVLQQKIDSMLFERTALSKKPEKLILEELSNLRSEGSVSEDLVFRDPYVLNFLGLKDTYSERDLENAILRELEGFLLELGTGFTFVARQKRMVIDNEDHVLDLLFYHRRLKRLVAVELKLGKFKAAFKGQMELYLRWLGAYEVEPGEDRPLGLILCHENRRNLLASNKL